MNATSAASDPAALEQAYRTARDFLFQEAALLDGGQFTDWLGLLTDDVSYTAPVRLTRERSNAGDISTGMLLFDETRQTLEWRVQRLKTEFAWAEDPPSRTRHFVSNVRVTRLETGEMDVTSYLLLYRNRGDEPGHDLLSAERRDTLRHEDGVWRLARRVVVLDQATLGTRNLGIFL